MIQRRNNDSITDIASKCARRKPYRAAVVAKTVKASKVIAEIKEALSANQIGFWCINISSGTHIFRTQNGSVIEVIDCSVFKHDDHTFHDVVTEGDGYRIIARRS